MNQSARGWKSREFEDFVGSSRSKTNDLLTADSSAICGAVIARAMST
jgi:hypothetical protein